MNHFHLPLSLFLLALAACSIQRDNQILQVKDLVERQQEYQAAHELITGVVARNPGSPAGRYWLAVVEFRLGRHQEAAQAMEKALSMGLYDSYHQSAYTYLGWARLHGGRPQAARDAFTRALRMAPTNPDARQGLLQVQQQMAAKGRPQPESRPAKTDPPDRKPPPAAAVKLELLSFTLSPDRIAGGATYGYTAELRLQDAAAGPGEELPVQMRFRVLKGEQTLFTSSSHTLDCRNGKISTIHKQDLPSGEEKGSYRVEVIFSFKGRNCRGQATLTIE